MQKLLSVVRRCIDDYEMIHQGDRIAIGVSGGKDSLALLCALSGLREFYPLRFSLCALTLDLGFGMDFSKVSDYCRSLGIEHFVRKTQIGHVVFEEHKQSSPCSMCSRMRRGALNELAREHGCSKLALGHHYDDAVETFMMSLIYEGRLSCFDPVTYLSRSDITQIRPMLYLSESAVESFTTRYDLPLVKNMCPADKTTKRQEIKELVCELNLRYPGLKSRTFSAMQRLPLKKWGPLHAGRNSKCNIMYSNPAQPPQNKEQPETRNTQNAQNNSVEPVEAKCEACKAAQQIEDIQRGKSQ